jgi:hypothetical protein
MARTFATWLNTETASRWELERELEREYEGLAYDLKVCGPGYPSPRKESIRHIHVALAKRGIVR